MNKELGPFTKDEFLIEIKDIDMYEFKSPREAKSYIRGRVKLAIQEVLIRPWREVLASDKE